MSGQITPMTRTREDLGPQVPNGGRGRGGRGDESPQVGHYQQSRGERVACLSSRTQRLHRPCHRTTTRPPSARAFVANMYQWQRREGAKLAMQSKATYSLVPLLFSDERFLPHKSSHPAANFLSASVLTQHTAPPPPASWGKLHATTPWPVLQHGLSHDSSDDCPSLGRFTPKFSPHALLQLPRPRETVVLCVYLAGLGPSGLEDSSLPQSQRAARLYTHRRVPRVLRSSVVSASCTHRRNSAPPVL